MKSQQVAAMRDLAASIEDEASQVREACEDWLGASGAERADYADEIATHAGELLAESAKLGPIAGLT